MSVEFSNFRVTLKRFAEAARVLTVVAALTYTAGAAQPAEAQTLNNVINQGLQALTGTATSTATTGSLPPTNLDSFVYQAGGNAFNIYGDESTGLPPFFGFEQQNRINAGITGINDAGLTTGHGSYMPDAWGADEFLAPPGEWSQSGANGGNTNYNGAAAGLDAQAAADAALAGQFLQNNAATTFTNLATGAVENLLGNAANNAINGVVNTVNGDINEGLSNIGSDLAAGSPSSIGSDLSNVGSNIGSDLGSMFGF